MDARQGKTAQTYQVTEEDMREFRKMKKEIDKDLERYHAPKKRRKFSPEIFLCAVIVTYLGGMELYHRASVRFESWKRDLAVEYFREQVDAVREPKATNDQLRTLVAHARMDAQKCNDNMQNIRDAAGLNLKDVEISVKQ